MRTVPLALGAIFGVATWFLLFVILGIGLGTSFIAFGSVLAAGVLASGLVFAERGRAIFDAPLTNTGLVFGIATFLVLTVVLSGVALWVAVVAGLAATGIYSMVEGALREGGAPAPARVGGPQAATARRYDGHDRAREPVMAR